MAKTRNLLALTKLTELSLVDNPANQHARAAIYKRATTLPAKGRVLFKRAFQALLAAATPHVQKEAQSYAQTRALSTLWERTSALSQSVSSIFSDGDLTAEERSTALEASINQFRADMLALSADDAAFSDEVEKAVKDVLTAAGDPPAPTPAPVTKTTADNDPPAAADPSAGASGDHEPVTQGNTMKRVLKTFTDLAAANAHIATLTGELETLDTTVDGLQAAADPLASITKGMPAAAAELFRKQAADLEALKSGQQMGILVAKAAGMIGNAGDASDATKLAKVLKVAGDDKEVTDFLEHVFKSYAALVAEVDGLEIGGSGAEEGSADAAEQLQKYADELRAADPKLTSGQAIAKAVRLHPELYNESEMSEAVTG